LRTAARSKARPQCPLAARHGLSPSKVRAPLTVIFCHIGGSVLVADSKNRPIDIDSQRRRGILRTAKFPFEIKGHIQLTVGVTEVFRAKKGLLGQINILDSIRTIERE
jgi:hypothetical protein